MTTLGTERDRIGDKNGGENWGHKVGTEIIKVSSPKLLCKATKECYLAHPIHSYIEVSSYDG